jgi:hypothetical protein
MDNQKERDAREIKSCGRGYAHSFFVFIYLKGGYL